MKTRIVLGMTCLAFSSFGVTAHADIVTDWNSAALEMIKANRTPPPAAARTLAMVQTAVFDAVNSFDRQYRSYAYNGVAPTGASKQAAVASAAYNVLKSLYPGASGTLQAKYESSIGSLSSGVSAGSQVGLAAANAIISKRANDGSQLALAPYMGSTEIGKWRPTSPTPGLLPQWGQVDTFGMQSGSQFRAEAPPMMDSAKYAVEYNEVKIYGAINSTARSADQTEIANFWAAGAGTVTPPGMWNQIAQEVGRSKGLTMEENARMMMVLNVGLADAGIACWDSKYIYSTWRPVTAIRNGDADGNSFTSGDENWTSLLSSPPFPAYSSGHSTFNMTGATILQGLLGESQFSLESAGTVRNFTSLTQAAIEGGMSRIYGGIHFQSDNQAGMAMGLEIGNYVLNSQAQPVPEPGTIAAIGLGLAALARKRKSSKKS